MTRFRRNVAATAGLALTLGSCLVAIGCEDSRPKATGDCDTAPWHTLVQSHLARYPRMQLVDAFKLVHHATLGSEHAIGDTTAVQHWMAREWGTMGQGPQEPVVDTLGSGANARYARVHLRPWRDAGGQPAPVVQAFIETARAAPGDTAQLNCAVQALVSMADGDDLPWPADSLGRAVEDWRQRHFPAVSHSPAYREAYAPAYRVMALPLVPSTPMSRN